MAIPVPESSPESVAELERALAAALAREAESLAREAATGAILRSISRAPTDLQTILDTIAENAARLCDATDAVIHRVEGSTRARFVAHFGPIPPATVPSTPGEVVRGTVPGQAILERRTVHIPDIADAEAEFPGSAAMRQRTGSRTLLATPLLREGVPLGSIMIRRTEVRPFTDQQIALLETFADQAAIAIENARLLQELEARNSDLGQSLEQQTATGEVLRVIASSPADLHNVLETVAENAMRLCDATDAVILRVEHDLLQTAAHFGSISWAGRG